MAELRSFRAARPPVSFAEELAAPPYDVVNREEARALASGKARSFLHVSRPDIDLPAEVDEHADAVYQKGAEHLRAFLSAGWLVQDESPGVYLYQQRMGAHVQIGVVALASVAEYDQGLIVRHELTRPEKEDDRTRHITALAAQDEPVFLAYRVRAELDALVAEGRAAAPVYDFTSDDGVGHTFWVTSELLGSRLLEAFEHVPRLYIADGHHRSAAASRVHARGGPGTASGFLAVIFPETQLQILGYHRLVRDLGGLSPEAFLEALAPRFQLSASAGAPALTAGQFALHLPGGWWRVVPREPAAGAARAERLDVSVLEREVLRPLPGIQDVRTDPRLQFVGGIRGAAELERQVASGAFAAAFLMHPPSMTDLLEVADAGELMPPKSTWFEPKLRSGLAVHLF